VSAPQQQVGLFSATAFAAAPGTIAINVRATLRSGDGYRAVFVADIPIAHFAEGDRMAEAHAMVMLVERGWAEQHEVAVAFGCSARTVRRAQRRFETGGLAALGRAAGYPKGRARARPTQVRRINDLKAQGLSNRAIAERLGVTEKAVRKLLRRLGWKEPEPRQPELPLGDGADPNLSASSITVPARTAGEAALAAPAPPEPPPPGADPNLSAPPSAAADEPLPVSFDTDPADRRIDRLFAYMGLLDDAAPLFRAGTRIPRAGVLLAIPALLHTGVLDAARDVYGGLGPAFYGLRTSLVTMLLMALLRIKRPEGLKEHAPDDLGRLLGLDRAPDVDGLPDPQISAPHVVTPGARTRGGEVLRRER
jgi:transposase